MYNDGIKHPTIMVITYTSIFDRGLSWLLHIPVYLTEAYVYVCIVHTKDYITNIVSIFGELLPCQ